MPKKIPLNPPQKRAVAQIDGPVLVLAGAGTGKTRVITARLAHMIESGIAPENLLAVTFTNKAAREMRERIASLVTRDAASQITVSTFHALGVRILRRDCEALGIKRNFTIYDDGDQIDVIKRLAKRLLSREEKIEPRQVIAQISAWKSSRTRPVNEQDINTHFYRAYQEELRQHHAVDFDDLLVLPVQLFEEHSPVLRAWQKRYLYLLVDEFQDSNALQLQLVKLLAGESQNICVVGDDDQSIYGWRGARMENLLEFESSFSNPAIIKLEQNYRSSMPILKASNSLIAHNPLRRAKRLWSDQQSPQRVRLIAMPGEREEAEYIIQEIVELCGPGKKRVHEDIAILLRTNFQSRIFEATLRENQVPYHLIGARSFFDRREVKDILAYLQVIANPHDDTHLLRVLNTPARGIGKNTVTLAMQESIEQKTSLYSILSSDRFREQLAQRTQNSLGALFGELGRLRDALAQNPRQSATLLEDFFESIDYPREIARLAQNEEEKLAREINYRDLLATLRDHLQRRGFDLQGFIDRLVLDKEKEEDEQEGRGVQLITLHAAKGLEFPHVYLVGLEQGILPHERSLEEGRTEEERRLLYVGMTRAQRRLTLTYCQQRTRYGDKLPRYPSCFLEELDSSVIEEINYEEEMSAPATEEAARDYFARMRESIAG